MTKKTTFPTVLINCDTREVATSEIEELKKDPKMFRKRKDDAVGRLFKERGEAESFVSVFIDYNIRRHFDAKQGDKHVRASLQGKATNCPKIKRQTACSLIEFCGFHNPTN